MPKKKFDSSWLAPIFAVLAIFAIWLSLTYLPITEWGITIPSDSLWIYLPWLVAFIVGLFTLKTIYRRH